MFAVFAVFATSGGVLGTTPAHSAQVEQNKVVSAVPASGTPHVLDGRVLSIVEVGNLIILGGRFSRVSSPDGQTVYNRDNVVAFDKRTGAVSTTFKPHTDGDVNALAVAPDGLSVYLGGRFDTIEGVGPRTLARLRISDGKPWPGFTVPSLDGRIKDMKIARGRLWIAGTFTHVAGHVQPALATLNPSNGAFDQFVRERFAAPRNDGALQVLKLEVSPDREKLVAIGNFTTIDGQPRYQAAMLNVGGTSAALANWRTNFYTAPCSSGFDSYMRDIDFSPVGDHFVIVTTGAYGGGPPGPCDTSARFEAEATGDDIDPSWVTYTGGDTTLSVTSTGIATYTGGHFRWQNNPWGAGRAQRGAISRPGLAALDPTNGNPFTWNPTRTLGVGVFDILATESGIWVGSDTDRIGNWLYRGRIAFFPLSGGTSVTRPYAGELPGDLYTAPAGLTSVLRKQYFNGTTVAPPSNVDNGGISWQNTRGAFMSNGTLYTGQSDGRFLKRSYNGTSFGSAEVIDEADKLVVDSVWHNEIRTINGMFFDDGRLYYASTTADRLSFRDFTPQSDIVDPRPLVATGGRTGLDWRQVRGMMLAGDQLYFGYVSNGTTSLRKIGFENGRLVGAVSVVDTSRSWDNRAMFLYAGNAPAQNETPTAAFDAPCDGLACALDASGSADSDGTIASYAWNFGDGNTATGRTVSHDYTDAGTYDITLTVTDDRGATDQLVRTVTVAPQQTGVRFTGASSVNANAQNFRTTIPSTTGEGDRLLLFLTLNATDRTIDEPSGVTGWTPVGTRSTSGTVTKVWQKSAAAGDPGASVGVHVSAYTKGAMSVASYGGTDPVVRDWQSAAETSSTTTHTTPTLNGVEGGWLVSYWGEKSSATTTWTAPSGHPTRSQTFGIGSGRISSLQTDSGGPTSTGPVGGLTATTDAASAQTTMWSILIGAAQ